MRSPGPELYHFLKKYQNDPTSKVFAPLAEAYRRAGLLDEAVEIAREGLNHHPNFASGRVALARALFDQKRFQQVLEELRAVLDNVPDNLVAQRLAAESHLMMGNIAEALASYKMLLYFHPGNIETAQIVRELEAQAYEKGALVLQYDVKPAEEALSEAPDVIRKEWIQRVEQLQSLLPRIAAYRKSNLKK